MDVYVVCLSRRFQPSSDAGASPAAPPTSNANPSAAPPGPPGPHGPTVPPPHPGKHEGRPSQTWMPPIQDSKDKVGLPLLNVVY